MSDKGYRNLVSTDYALLVIFEPSRKRSEEEIDNCVVQLVTANGSHQTDFGSVLSSNDIFSETTRDRDGQRQPFEKKTDVQECYAMQSRGMRNHLNAPLSSNNVFGIGCGSGYSE